MLVFALLRGWDDAGRFLVAAQQGYFGDEKLTAENVAVEMVR